jgi:hypothetical protein
MSVQENRNRSTAKMEIFFDHSTTELKVHPSMNEYSKHFKLPKNQQKLKQRSKSKPNPSNATHQIDRKFIRELAEDAAQMEISQEE